MSEYSEYLKEVLEHFGPIVARKMFGGYGIYYQGLMFGLVVDNQLYLKVDAENLPYFEARGLPPFAYNKQGRLMKMSYYLAPEEILENRDEAAVWARRSWQAAQRVTRSKRSTKKNRG